MNYQAFTHELHGLMRSLRETYYKIIGIDRSFRCQSDIEGHDKCKFQCSHCETYYRPVERRLKKYKGRGNKMKY